MVAVWGEGGNWAATRTAASFAAGLRGGDCASASANAKWKRRAQQKRLFRASRRGAGGVGGREGEGMCIYARERGRRLPPRWETVSYLQQQQQPTTTTRRRRRCERNKDREKTRPARSNPTTLTTRLKQNEKKKLTAFDLFAGCSFSFLHCFCRSGARALRSRTHLHTIIMLSAVPAPPPPRPPRPRGPPKARRAPSWRGAWQSRPFLRQRRRRGRARP